MPVTRTKSRFGENLEALLEKRDMNKSQLAEKMGCSRQRVSLLIYTEKPHDETLKQIRKILRCRKADLIK